uniref:Uncharacterized protein n=1 Tax=Rhizophora mucronata TaxID=61149 RepID=A0A2P2NBW1_RHIMU
MCSWKRWKLQVNIQRSTLDYNSRTTHLSLPFSPIKLLHLQQNKHRK